VREENKIYGIIRRGNLAARSELKKQIFIIGIAASTIGIILTLVMGSHLASVLSYVGGLVSMILALIFFNKNKKDIETCMMFIAIYFAFVYIPIDWFVYGGVLGSTPYVSIVPITIMVMTLSNKKLKIMIPIYMAVLLSLIFYSLSTEPILNNSENLNRAIFITAAYFVCISIITYSLLLMLNKLDNLYRRTLDDSIKDRLTGALNRRGLDDVLSIAEAKYIERNVNYTIAMVDVDCLKQLNDKHGHAAGDLVLQRLADCIERSIRTDDFVLRYGGDEFLILLQSIPIENVKIIFNRIEGFLQEEYRTNLDYKVSFSRGFAQRTEFDSSDNLVDVADKRMYEYKQKECKACAGLIG